MPSDPTKLNSIPQSPLVLGIVTILPALKNTAVEVMSVRLSQLLFVSLREVPAEVELISHKLLLCVGFI